MVAQWRDQPVDAVARALASRCAGDALGVIAVDGRSAAGKTTRAARLAAALPAAVVLHTDDFAWHQSFFGWAALARGVLADARAGHGASYRPPAWDARGRDGSIDVPAGSRFVLLEGVGAGRRELTDVVDALVWVESDFAEAERRGIERDGGDAAVVAFWREWMAEEIPFLLAERPWDRADLIVDGTPPAGATRLRTAGWSPRG